MGTVVGPFLGSVLGSELGFISFVETAIRFAVTSSSPR